MSQLFSGKDSGCPGAGDVPSPSLYAGRVSHGETIMHSGWRTGTSAAPAFSAIEKTAARKPPKPENGERVSGGVVKICYKT